MPNVIDPIVAILATPLSQTPLPHVLRLPSRQPPHQRGPTDMAVAPKPRPLPGNTPMAPTVVPPPCLQQATLPRPAVTRPPTRRQPRQFPGIDPIKVPPGSSDGPARLRRVRAKRDRSFLPSNPNSPPLSRSTPWIPRSQNRRALLLGRMI